MNKTVILLTSAVALAFGAPAFAVEKETYKAETKVEKDSKGNYDSKSTVKHTDTAGTTTTSEKKVEVDVDSKGNTDTTVKTEQTNDPKGLMNKTTTKTEDTETHKDSAVKTSHKKVVNGKTVEEEKTDSSKK